MKAETADKYNKIVELYKLGINDQEIAKRIGYKSTSTVNEVARVYRKRKREERHSDWQGDPKAYGGSMYTVNRIFELVFRETPNPVIKFKNQEREFIHNCICLSPQRWGRIKRLKSHLTPDEKIEYIRSYFEGKAVSDVGLGTFNKQTVLKIEELTGLKIPRYGKSYFQNKVESLEKRVDRYKKKILEVEKEIAEINMEVDKWPAI